MSIFKPASAHKYHFGKSFKRLEVRSIVQSFRERLEKSQISPQTGSTDILSRLQVLQPQSNYTGPLDVSVGKTWGTNLVAAARRDAKFVPFRLLTTKAESPFHNSPPPKHPLLAIKPRRQLPELRKRG